MEQIIINTWIVIACLLFPGTPTAKWAAKKAGSYENALWYNVVLFTLVFTIYTIYTWEN